MPIADKHMFRRRALKRRTSNVLLLILAIVAVVSVAVAAVVVTDRFRRDAQSTKTSEQVEKLTDTIELPMYGELLLQANRAKQAFGFSNPPQNFCYIQPSLWLADGTLLWRGLLIAPGDVGNLVTLSQPLPEGTYTGARLHYDCFTMNEEKTQLNGGECILALIVQ